MAEFVFKSRKSQTNNPEFEVEKLQKPDATRSLEFLESKAEVVRLEKQPDTLPRLPWQLERLLSTASSELLPRDPVMLSAGLITDLNRYTLAWGCSYLTGDRAEAERRLWQVYRAWQEVTD